MAKISKADDETFRRMIESADGIEDLEVRTIMFFYLLAKTLPTKESRLRALRYAYDKCKAESE